MVLQDGNGKGTLTKAGLVRLVHERVGITHREAKLLVEETLSIIKEALLSTDDGRLKISGFGSFSVRDKAARMGQNPKTLEKIVISKRRVLVFKTSQLLKAQLNGDGE